MSSAILANTINCTPSYERYRKRNKSDFLIHCDYAMEMIAFVRRNQSQQNVLRILSPKTWCQQNAYRTPRAMQMNPANHIKDATEDS